MRIKDSRRGLCADSQDKSWSTSLTVPVFLLHFSSLFLLLFLLVSRIFSALFLFPFFCRHSMFHSRPRQLWRLYICVGTKEKTLGNKTTGELVPQCLTDVAASRCETIHRAQQRTTPTFFPSSNVVSNCPGKQQHSTVMKNTLLFSKFVFNFLSAESLAIDTGSKVKATWLLEEKCFVCA